MTIEEALARIDGFVGLERSGGDAMLMTEDVDSVRHRWSVGIVVGSHENFVRHGSRLGTTVLGHPSMVIPWACIRAEPEVLTHMLLAGYHGGGSDLHSFCLIRTCMLQERIVSGKIRVEVGYNGRDGSPFAFVRSSDLVALNVFVKDGSGCPVCSDHYRR